MKSLFLFILLFLLFSCKGEGENTSKNSENSNRLSEISSPEILFDFAENGYKCFKGKIGKNLAVTIHLHKSDTSLSGYYYYDNVGLPLELKGSVKENGRFKLEERDKFYEKTGEFRGKFVSNDKIEGKWIHPKTKKELDFSVTVHTEGVAQFTSEIFDKEDCSNREKYLKNPRDDDDTRYTDTICSSIHLELLKLKTNRPEIDTKINKRLLKGALYVGEESEIQGYLNSLKDMVAEFGFMETETFVGVTTNDSDILCVYISSWEYSGGAHPNGSLEYLNFDLKTGAELKLKDVLKANFLKDFSGYAEQKLYKEYEEEDDWFFEKGEFPLTENFAITPGGLLFYFNSYEIASYAAGRQELFFTYKELEKYILPNSVLRRFMK